MYYAIIQNNKVINILVCDFEPYWFKTNETSVVLINENELCSIGMKYIPNETIRFQKDETE